ncbi:hypothetical protein [Tateyamaria omphalii]|uniref:Transferrin-binding protein B C-lobe/N-lobe beta barrel domain-containing protein n=1 Tax=Tateyamaria omphalii TaxID=299262 RepID=A0A1P8MQT7_9RHOB|nr:hypothetical protein [Tateyamaria omphalii]APX10394.1 hypothetical protein BWR18_00780 [Tateyamaria omphalii]
MGHKSLYGIVALTCACALAGCSGSSTGGFGGGSGSIPPGLTTDSRIVTLTANGNLPDVGIVGSIGNSFSKQSFLNGSGFAYQLGRVRGTDTFLGVAGILPNNQVGGAPTVATASYAGDYNLSYADSNSFETNVAGKITLNADFGQGTLIGQSGGLAVNGNITGQNIGGTASYRGVDAPLAGRIGNDRAVGAFAGHTNRKVLVGGFIAERPNQNP